MNEAARHTPIEELDLFRTYVAVADWIWRKVRNWDALERDTVGVQLIRASDSVGANLVEGDGRFGDRDGVRFLVIARASARETRYWLERAVVREILTSSEGNARIEALTLATRQLNRLIAYRRSRFETGRVSEPTPDYEADDPFTAP